MVTTKKSKSRQRRSTTPPNNFSRRIFDDALGLAGILADGQKNLGAEKIFAFADAAREFGRSVSSVPHIRSYVTLAAESLEGLADYVLETDFDQMLDDAGVFAKRHPLAVMGAGVTGGLIGMQMMRSNLGQPARGNRKRSSGRIAARRPAARQRTRGGRQTNGRAHLDA